MSTETGEEMRARQFAQFDTQGEDQVRLWLQNFNNPTANAGLNMRKSWAIEWLAQFDQQSRLRNEASQAESIEIAKSAKDAAWEAANAARDAAREARTANTIAKLALIGAATAIAVSILGLVLR
jgi:hypothetical protein